MDKALIEQLSDGKERGEYDFKMTAAFQAQIFQKYKDRLTEQIRPYILLIAGEIPNFRLILSIARIRRFSFS
jgi:hypothetical protein